jgi:hypothetical protein
LIIWLQVGLMMHRVKDFKPAAIVPSRLNEDERKAAIEKLDLYFACVDAQRQPVSQEEECAIIDEALRLTRPGYRPAS